MSLHDRSRPTLLRAAAALRRAGASLARVARGGRGPAGPPEAAPGSPGDGAFLSEVKETLLQISAAPGPPGADASPGRGPAAPGPRPEPPSRLRRAAALLEAVRRHEDLVLALALLAGIAVMILHWVP